MTEPVHGVVRRLAIPAYAIAGLLVVFPLVDAVTAIWPLRFGDPGWRFGTGGLLSRGLMMPLLGFLVAYSVALLGSHERTLRVISVLSAIVVLLILVGLAGFALDALQIRARVRPDARPGIDMATIGAFGKYLLGIAALLSFAICGWKASRSMSRARPPRAASPSLLLGLRRPGHEPPSTTHEVRGQD